MDKELFKELYLYELLRKEELTGRVTVLLTAVTVVGALGGYLLEASSISKDFWSLIFASFLAATVVFYCRSIYFLTRLYSGYTYAAIPTPANLHAYYEELVTFYKDNPDAKGDADSEFTSYLNKRYAEATEVNSHNNEAKAAYHIKSLQSLVLALLFLGIAALPRLLKNAIMLN